MATRPGAIRTARAKRGSGTADRARGVTEARTRKRACHHHWVIEPPNGPRSTGHCKLCGRNRTFPNSSEDSIWDGAEGRSRWNDMGMTRRRRNQDDPIMEENVVEV